MEITVSQEQGRVLITVLRIKGEINTNTAGEFQAEARKAYDDGARDMLIDLSGVSYITSAGLRVLHEIFSLLRSDSPEESDEAIKKGIIDGSYTSPHLKLLKPNKNVQEVLSTAGYDMFLEIHSNRKNAIASF
jgi:anti-anti-sigma factor